MTDTVLQEMETYVSFQISRANYHGGGLLLVRGGHQSAEFKAEVGATDEGDGKRGEG